MHGLTENDDFSFLVSKELIQICIGFNQVIMQFDGDISISVETPIKHIDSCGNEYIYENNKSIGSEFISLLGKGITSVIPNAGVLKLVFDKGEAIELVEDDKAFESFHISMAAKTIAI